jgi:DNA (cytosine-5)-methyltransferase 1
MCLAGFSCQAFSSAGKRLGFKDRTRGTLIFRVLQLLEARKPKCFLLENVEGLVTHGGGETLRTIMGALSELGYSADCKVLNSRNFGVAQNRPRIYIIGFMDPKVMNSFSWPEPTDSTKTLKDIIEPGPVDAKYYISQQYMNTLIAHRARHESKGQGFGYDVRSRDDVANCLVLGGMGHERNLIQDRSSLKEPVRLDNRKTPTNDDFLRRMTPLEWERLQGYPDSWTAGESNTARWKALGNTVTVNTIQAVAAQMINAMTNPSEDSNSFFDDDDLKNDVDGCTEEIRAEKTENKERVQKGHEQIGVT